MSTGESNFQFYSGLLGCLIILNEKYISKVLISEASKELYTVLSEQISTLVPTVAFSDLSSVEGLNHVRDLQIKSKRVKKIIFLL